MNVDEEAVQLIINARTHYELLCVEVSADGKEIKKQYKKLALSVHPDKNASPKADEAFKLLRAAFECLSDPLKRIDYNKTIAVTQRKRPASGTSKAEREEMRKKKKRGDARKKRAGGREK